MASPRAVSGAVNDDVVSRHDKSPGSDVRSRGSRKEDAARHLLSHLAPHRIRRAVHSLRPLVSGTRGEVQGGGDRGARAVDHRWSGTKRNARRFLSARFSFFAAPHGKHVAYQYGRESTPAVPL